MNKENKLVPEIRFPEFKNEGEWEEKSLKKLGNLINGLTYSPNDIRDKGLLVLRSSNVQNGQIVLNDCVYVNPEIKGANLTKQDDILVCIRNGSKALIGKNAIIPENIPLATHGAFMTVFRATNPKFVFQLFQTDAYNNQVNADLGATINSINGGNFLKYKFTVPKPKEQEKIATCLSSLDEVIAAHSQKLDTLKDHKKGLMQNLFPQEGETVPKFRFKEFEKDGEWVEEILGNVIKYFKGFAFQSIDYTSKGRRIIRVSDMGFDYIKNDENAIYINEGDAIQYEKWQLKKDDLIITTVGSKPPMYDSLVGRTIIVESKDESALLNQNAVCLRANSKIAQEFLNTLFKKSEYVNFIESIIRGNANQGSIALEDLFKYKFLQPKNPKEQKKIASCLSSLDSIITAQADKIEQLKLHKKGLMQGLFPNIND